MEIVLCEDLSEADFDSIRASKPVLLVGSAVSIFAPTNLPNGKSVTDDLLARLASGGSSGPWPDWLIAAPEQLPFEAVLEAYPDQDSLPEIICRLFGEPNVKPNRLHEAIGDGVAQGLFSGLITTNYDLAFDNYFARTNAEIATLLREEEGRAWMSSESKRPAYWKIHGTARVEDSDTIVANLARERRMDDWKQCLLKRLVEGRTLIFLGYSGRDFDVCPELARVREAFDAVWLAQPPKHGGQLEPNDNRSRIIKKTEGQVVLGDLYVLLEKLCQNSIERSKRLSAPVDVWCYFDSSLQAPDESRHAHS